VFAVLDLPVSPTRESCGTSGSHSVVPAAIEFDGVSFGYDTRRAAIRDITLAIEPGTKVAIVGPTGCGKSTLLGLLLRFYEPSAGEIRLGGRPLAQIDPAELRGRMGVVPQDAFVFRGTIADNIRYGAPDANHDRVVAAARAALVDDFVRELPAGYDTVVGEGGHRLSQGQRQRLAIARAICTDPAIVLLDEATASLDPAAETQVQAALDNLLQGRTAIVVAHRLPAIANADRIVVMDDGRTVQTGTHLELLAEAGLYRRLWKAQTEPPVRSRRRPRRRVPA
jgi:ABC-type multidrug transport system fused ATPase/permease subunit